MRRRELLFAANDTGEDTILDVLFSKNDGSSLEIFSPREWPDASGYTPIGIVVVPASHNRYGDGSCGVMSLVGMDYSHPTSGIPITGDSQTDNVPMYWGHYNATVGNDIFRSTTALTASYNYIPYQVNGGSTATSSKTDNAVIWPYQGTSTAPTSAASTEYSNTNGYVKATTGKSGCDFNGIRNTAALYVKTRTSSQWTASTVSNETGTTNTPAAACCGRFKTIGTNAFIDVYNGITSNNINYGTNATTKTNTGYWYLPAEGELCYLPSKKHEINKIVAALNAKYGNVAVKLDTNGPYRSSSERDSDYALSVDMLRGYLGNDKKTLESRVRAFLRFNPNTIDDYEYVDLGLPSGLKWAKCNVGASSETEYGNYYQYGKGNATYQTTSAQSIYNKTDNVLPLSADTAQQVMHGGWRMPTSGECEELLHNTTYEFITTGSSGYITGVRFTSKKDSSKSIFIPAGGAFSDGVRRNYRKSFSIWSSTSYDKQTAYNFNMNYDYQYGTKIENALRKYGYNIRGVHA